MPRGRKRKAKHPEPEAKRSSADAEDALQWLSSDSEPEDYGNLGNQERWAVDGIIDSHRGENDRMSYKIRWNKDDWRRKDGTSEEWIPAPKKNSTEHQTLIRKYEAQDFDHFNSQSYIYGEIDEEFDPLIRGPPSVSKNLWFQTGMGHALSKHQEKENGDMRAAGIMMFDINDRNFARNEHGSEDDEEPARPAQPARLVRPVQSVQPRGQSSQLQPKREPSVEERPTPSPSLGGSRNASQAVDLTQPSPLDELANEWSERAESVGAASITLTNDTNTPRSIPKLKESFEYNEMAIDWGHDATDPFDEMFVSCRCSDQCDRPHACGCQDPLFEGVVDVPRGLHKFAYTRKGLFRFDYEGVAIECNRACRCASNCPNRVAQQPRKIPLDIFTPSIQDWGVRPLCSVKAGQVLGTFTGEVISREKAQDMRRVVIAKEMSTGNKVEFKDHNRQLDPIY
ncbi:hypothetical protein FRC09_005846 [Ceratobasidium sp. 395]|nr:hypothetical protein FRC09_005846 [Ceratobasidium sp. 395]